MVFQTFSYINKLLKLHLLWQFRGCISNWFVTDGECRVDWGLILQSTLFTVCTYLIYI